MEYLASNISYIVFVFNKENEQAIQNLLNLEIKKTGLFNYIILIIVILICVGLIYYLFKKNIIFNP